MRALRPVLAALALLGAGGVAAAAAGPADDSLGVGMQAPPLAHVNWLKGEKVTAWEPGQIYVLDFWATWCPPCRKSIPHVNALAKKHRPDGVHVIGVAIAPRPGMVPTGQFVAEQGDGMDYRVAEDIDGQTAVTFMQAARCDGIPTIMVIDRQGQLAWIGGPSELETRLAQIVAGTDDRAAAIAADAARRAPADLQGKLDSALKDHATFDAATAAEVLKLCEQQLAAHPKNPQLAYVKYLMLAKTGPKEAAASYGRQLVDGPLRELPKALHLLAWTIVDPRSTTPLADRDLALALVAASRADELTAHADPSVVDTLARVQFSRGDVSRAIELQKQALELAQAAELKAELQATLDEYERAAASSPAGG